MTVEMMWNALRYGLVPTLGFVFVVATLVQAFAYLRGSVRLQGQFALLFGFSLLGGILGLATGNSRLAAVSVLLGTLLSVVTMLLGFLFGEQRLGPVRMLMPYCILAVLISTLYGLFLGAILRRENERFQEATQHDRLHEQQVEWELEKARGLADLRPATVGGAEE